ncbi:LPS export ABC transporter permease LptF [Mesorhizobium sp. M2D.F.Ca.ET.185.01.1.1]|uniref:LPS export ABC transporter permease LptF n=1 Tax=unclassified Mesorhizobium TaxID=325217 RepID=UPI000FCB6490|nr:MULTISPECIES: LPS export ABC transporter permease LptF [unclassified Mesorhizobium]TGP57148.1 LPS export ABC transporter permease LptF [bacterium M00.F.Ca.ET.230.01.1.1]TGP76938.1 LPS export ABC transporter permease LptF [bacterium M00.F.Ca.ET.227.01.1.1]TGP84933.1 LPS export ABC transporter permease LptF [bacterium M00.F.Ca.ET.221.01.1.1]TGP88503.1 LPS export ABC transporter permease LptF [bacterium M00.F.Ca.ET.222.01.1.1]TGT68597.1 LPS export ABC transporter permease LptF [bacterium M00.F
MKVVERYIMRRALTMFLAALVWTLAIVWTTQVLAKIDLVTDNGQSALTFFEVAALIIPSIIPIVVPFALVVAVAQTLSAMNTDSELAVLSAAGASRWTIARPILLLAIAACAFSFIVDNAIDPYARQKNRQLVAASRADLVSLIIQEGTFRKIDEGLYLQVGERLPGNRLGGIFVADSREEGASLTYYAKSGSIVEKGDEKVLMMNDGVINRKSVTGDLSVIRFTSYAFDLSAFMSAANDITLLPKDRTTAYLLNPDPNDKMFQREPGSYWAELNQRFAEWSYSLVFALIALAVAGDARSHREARINPLITAIAVALFVRWLGFFAAGKADRVGYYVYLLYAIPLVASAVSIWFIVSSRSMELPVSWADWLTNLAKRAGDSWTAFKLWLARRTSGQGA